MAEAPPGFGTASATTSGSSSSSSSQQQQKQQKQQQQQQQQRRVRGQASGSSSSSSSGGGGGRQQGRGRGSGRGNGTPNPRGRGFGGPPRSSSQPQQQRRRQASGNHGHTTAGNGGRNPQQQQQQQQDKQKAPRKSNAELAEEMRKKQAAFIAKLLAKEEAEEAIASASAGGTANASVPGKSAWGDASTAEDDGRDCLICTSPVHTFPFGSCNHCQVCIDCIVKKRVFFEDFACVICKAENVTMVVANTPPERRGFETYNLTNLENVRPTGCYFVDHATATTVRRQLAKRCPICVANGDEETVYSVKNLKAHVAKVHGKSFCGVCLDNRRVFCHEQRLYSGKELREHFRSGDKAKGEYAPMPAHPNCRFCDRRKFFDKDALEKHERDAHFRCTLCTHKNLFPDYERLFDHFARDHFLCDHPSCLAQKFIAFRTQMELQNHQVKVHNDKSARKISLAPPSRSGNRAGQSSVFHESADQAYDGPAPETGGGAVRQVRPADVRSQDMDVKQRLQAALGNDKVKLTAFRTESHDYRRGKISADEYVFGFFELFGKGSNSVRLFKDLIDLLPDLRQRTELLEVMERTARSNSTSRPVSAAEVAARNSGPSRSSSANGGRGRGRGRGNSGRGRGSSRGVSRAQRNRATMSAVAGSRGLAGGNNWPALSSESRALMAATDADTVAAHQHQQRMNDAGSVAAHATHGREMGGRGMVGANQKKKKGRKKKVLLSWG